MSTAACPLTIEIESTPNAAVVKCHGKLIAGVGDALYGPVSALSPDHKRVVIDLTDLTRVDSLGLGTLVRLYVSARSAGSTLELINIGKQLRELLGMTNLFQVFATMGENGIKMG
ncbi:MAG TPA: STAS domain-containing protein [Acidobacteriaceae bacterium]|nr:STAS domain-containing protein [Acidobacteriaceae bacterium]